MSQESVPDPLAPEDHRQDSPPHRGRAGVRGGRRRARPAPGAADVGPGGRARGDRPQEPREHVLHKRGDTVHLSHGRAGRVLRA